MISFNTFATATLKQETSTGTIQSLTSGLSNNTNNNIYIEDGSANFGDISINLPGLRYFLEIGAIHGDASKNTAHIDIFATLDASSQPLNYCNRIVGSNYDNLMISSKDVNNETIPTIVRVDVASITDDLLNGTKSEMTNQDGIAEFDNIDFFKGADDQIYKEYKLEFKQNDPEDNLQSIITESFNMQLFESVIE